MSEEEKELKFTCPECGEHRLEEVMIDVTVSSEITRISDDGDHDYGEQTNEDGETSHYQCMNGTCGYVVGLTQDDDEGINGCQELAQWIQDQEIKQRRDEKRGLYPDKADISN